MMRDLEFIIMGVFVVGIMFCMFVDVLIKDKAMRFSYQSQLENESSEKSSKVIEVFEGLADFGAYEETLPLSLSSVQKREVVYPMYIDCSRNTLQAQPPAC
ncbi:hypothetical protein [Paenibacillus sp. P36]|uniref:hypothetical protein n=1 Tax=Paenibacillus sp. P36 TaxID=3342538 RepID=UPI0038B30CB8